jgi:hypothetical protein
MIIMLALMTIAMIVLVVVPLQLFVMIMILALLIPAFLNMDANILLEILMMKIFALSMNVTRMESLLILLLTVMITVLVPLIVAAPKLGFATMKLLNVTMMMHVLLTAVM